MILRWFSVCYILCRFFDFLFDFSLFIFDSPVFLVFSLFYFFISLLLKIFQEFFLLGFFILFGFYSFDRTCRDRSSFKTVKISWLIVFLRRLYSELFWCNICRRRFSFFVNGLSISEFYRSSNCRSSEYNTSRRRTAELNVNPLIILFLWLRGALRGRAPQICLRNLRIINFFGVHWTGDNIDILVGLEPHRGYNIRFSILKSLVLRVKLTLVLQIEIFGLSRRLLISVINLRVSTENLWANSLPT